MVVADLVEAVATELFEEGVGQHDGHHGLAHDAGGRHRADVAALDDRLHRLLGGEVHRPERRTQRGQRLHGCTHDDGLSVGHAPLETARVVRRAPEPVSGLELDLVVHARARAPCRLDASNLGSLGAARQLVQRNVELAEAHAADLGHVAQNADAELREQPLGHARHGHARGGLAGTGALEHVANVAVAVLHRAGEVGVARSRARDLFFRRPGLGHGHAHRRLPVLPVTVRDAERDGRAQRRAPANAGQDMDLVALDLHAPTASVAALAAREIAVDVGFGQRQTGRDAVDDGRERLTVGLSRGEEAEDAPHDRILYLGTVLGCRLARGVSRRTRLGVTKMTSSRLGVVCVSFDLKSQPMTGISPNTGIFRMLSVSVRWVMPPTTSVSPSLTSTSVSARRLLMVGTSATPPRFTRSPAESSATWSFILMRVTLFGSYTTVGVTSSRSAASLNWTCVPAELTVA